MGKSSFYFLVILTTLTLYRKRVTGTVFQYSVLAACIIFEALLCVFYNIEFFIELVETGYSLLGRKGGAYGV
jgi:hypothetical protein